MHTNRPTDKNVTTSFLMKPVCGEKYHIFVIGSHITISRHLWIALFFETPKSIIQPYNINSSANDAVYIRLFFFYLHVETEPDTNAESRAVFCQYTV